MIMENRHARPDLWQRALTYTEILHGTTRFRAKEKVRRNWFYKNGFWGDYVANVPAGPVTLPFSLWEQAEARHKDDKAEVRKLSREERKMIDSISWGTLNGRGSRLKDYSFVGVTEPPMRDPIDSEFLMKLTGDEWVETKTYNAKSVDWKPQGEIYIMSGKPLDFNKEKD